jgi:hypothetical protein
MFLLQCCESESGGSVIHWLPRSRSLIFSVLWIRNDLFRIRSRIRIRLFREFRIRSRIRIRILYEYIHTHTNIYTHTHIYTHKHTNIHKHKHTYICTRTYTLVFICNYYINYIYQDEPCTTFVSHTYTYINTHTYIYIYTYVYMCVCVCVVYVHVCMCTFA